MKSVVFIIYFITLAGCYNQKSPIKTGFEGNSLPVFSMILPDSITHVNTGNIPNGQAVVLFYFSPRCPFCRAQMDEIIGSISSMKKIRFYIFTTWPFDELRDFYRHYQLNKFSNIVVGLDYNNFFANHFKAQGVPYIAVYGKDKKLKEVFVGNVYGKQIKEVAEN